MLHQIYFVVAAVHSVAAKGWVSKLMIRINDRLESWAWKPSPYCTLVAAHRFRYRFIYTKPGKNHTQWHHDEELSPSFRFILLNRDIEFLFSFFKYSMFKKPLLLSYHRIFAIFNRLISFFFFCSNIYMYRYSMQL